MLATLKENITKRKEDSDIKILLKKNKEERPNMSIDNPADSGWEIKIFSTEICCLKK
jgi:hypothetical protein